MPTRSAVVPALALLVLAACEEQIADAPYIAALNEPGIIRAEDAAAQEATEPLREACEAHPLVPPE